MTTKQLLSTQPVVTVAFTRFKAVHVISFTTTLHCIQTQLLVTGSFP